MTGVSRSGYYKWKERKGIFNRYELNQVDLDRLSLQYHQMFPSLGYRSINRMILNDTGWVLCDLSVHKSMKRQRISALPRRRKYHYYSDGSEHQKYPNHLNREFASAKPVEKIVTDIAHMRSNGSMKHFSLFFDLYNNAIIAAQISNTEDNQLVVSPLRRMLEEKSIGAPLLLHSDQGCQYSSYGFRSLLKKYNVIQSMSRAGTPRDNAVAESLIGRFKDVLCYDFHFRSSPKPEETFWKAVSFFNNRRPAYALNYKTPAQYTTEQGYDFSCLQTID